MRFAPFLRSREATALAGAGVVALLCAWSIQAIPTTRAEEAAPASSRPASLSGAAPADAELLRQLGSDDWRQREAAEEQLLKLGDEKAPVFKQFVDQTQNPEARSRAQDILARIAERRLTGPSLVTLHRHGASTASVLDDLFKQARGEYVVWPPNLFQDGTSAPMDADFDHKPFLAALKEICGKAGLNARFVYDREHVTLIREQSAPMFGPTIVEGPVLVAADGVNSTAQVHFANPAAAYRSATLSLEILLEPRLHITQGFVEVLKMEDEKGKSLIPQARMGGASASASTLNFSSEFYWSAQVPLSFSRDGTRIATFRARLHLQAHAHTERVEIPDVLKAKEVTKVVDGRRFTLHDVSRVGPDYQMQLTLYRDGMSAEDWAWFSYPYARVRLLDANDHDLSPASGGGGGGNESNFNMTLTRQNYGQGAAPGEPATLVWELPLKTREIDVPIAFDNLPLP